MQQSQPVWVERMFSFLVYTCEQCRWSMFVPIWWAFVDKCQVTHLAEEMKSLQLFLIYVVIAPVWLTNWELDRSREVAVISWPQGHYIKSATGFIMTGPILLLDKTFKKRLYSVTPLQIMHSWACAARRLWTPSITDAACLSSMADAGDRWSSEPTACLTVPLWYIDLISPLKSLQTANHYSWDPCSL